MLRNNNTLSYQDTRSICTSYDLRREIKCFSLHPNQQIVAVGCSSELKLIRIDESCRIQELFSTAVSTIPNVSITDMAWNPLDHHRLAIANSIGEIKCFNFPSSSNTPSNQPSPSVGSGSGGVGGSGGMMQLEWSGEKASTSINRLAWSPHDASILATGSGDGSIKFYDIRASKNTASQTYRQKGPIASPCRDLKFNLKDSSIFASASDSGRLHIWDKRWTQRALMTFEAHKRPVLTIAWNPSSEWIIASGSADRTVKVWDTGKCDLHSGSSHLTAAMTSSGINPMTMTPVITDVDPLLTQTIYTSGEVSRLLWNPTEQSSTSSNSSYSQHILTMSGSVGADHNAGYISLWDLQRPHIPIVSLRGHGNDACTMIDWIDCKRSSDLLEFQVGKGVISAKLKRAAGGGNSPITPGTSASPSKMKAVTSTDPKATSINSSNSINNGSGMLGERREAVTRLTVPWVLSSGKSTILIESLKYGFFPYNHLSPVVASLSSQGHLAFQHAQVRKMEEPPKTLPHASGLKNQKITSNHSSQGRKSDTTASSDGSRASSRSASPTPSLAGGGGDGGLGKVFFGFADFGDLAEAEKVRAKGGAEATVFDPALIHLLATHYYVPQLPPPPRYASDVDLEVEIEGEQKNTSAIAVTSPLSFDYNYLVLCYDIAVTSCRKNFAVASAAGLNCRASVWASLEALLPYPQDIGTNAASDTPEVVFSDDLPFTTEVIATLLSELLEGGDAQHFVVMCEILRCAQILPRILQSAQIPARRTRSIYVAYIDLLMRLELFAQANQIVKSSDDEEIAAMSRKDVEIKIQCGGCKKSELRRKDVRVAAATVYCQTCKACVSRCSLCDLPVTGLLQWCPICGHGGHLSCLKKWFSLYTCCPTGCGHQCCVSLYQPDDSATSSAPQPHHRSRENGAEEVLEEEVEDDIDKLLHRRRQSLKNMRRKQLTQRFS